jgi:hypothetical protein
MSANPLPTGDAARRLELVHLYVTAPIRLTEERPSAAGQAPAHAALGGVSCDRQGWLVAWVVYVPSTADVPTPSLWPVVRHGVCVDVVLPPTAEFEVLARTDTPKRAVSRLARHLESLSVMRIDPDIDYLERAAAAYRADLRRERDQQSARQAPTEQP